jgi:hypothetical protein
MGTIVIHAGMPKAGSSTVQHWLAANAKRLRREHLITLAVAREADPVRVGEYDGRGSINSQAMVLAMREVPEVRARAMARFFEDLGAIAERHPLVALTSESFADTLWRPDDDFLQGLDQLASRHHVRLSCYLRPQHTAMEAAWRQWGFRSGKPPSMYLGRRARQLHYLATYRLVRSRAPQVEFEPRPFRADLLDEGDIVVDFAGRYLDVQVEPGGTPPVNPGLPLDLVNLLRAAPADTFWSSAHDNRVLNQIKDVFRDLHVPESEEAVMSRHVLESVCHELFESENRELIGELGWATTEWVPEPSEPVGGGIELLDQLWAPHASRPELQILFHAIAKAVRAR